MEARMRIRSKKDVEMLQAIGAIVAGCLRSMRKRIRPGVTTRELDDHARDFLTARGALSAPEVVYRFPGATCISIHPDVAHGIPGRYRLKPGDVVNIDVSAVKEGYFADTGGTFQVPPRTPEIDRLFRATRAALQAGMAVARHGVLLREIGRVIEDTALKRGFTVLENLGSHGVGRSLHEAPKFIASYPDPRDRRVLEAGQVITLEPFLSTGATWADERGDGWTLGTRRSFFTAQFEHSLVITRGKPIVLTV